MRQQNTLTSENSKETRKNKHDMHVRHNPRMKDKQNESKNTR